MSSLIIAIVCLILGFLLGVIALAWAMAEEEQEDENSGEEQS